ncbi:MAG TPA: hypothetical protein VN851_14315 [Thermoanaerobaculia bacterium]|nr:hypothetical protein [Thermoanaerobaculia bacterium]
MRRRRPSESGSAVALALMLLLVLGLALAVLSEGIVARMREEQRESQSVRLSAACDAALAESLAGLAASPDYPGFAAQEFADGTIESNVQSVGTGRLVRARATLGGKAREIEAEIRFSSGRPFVARWRRVK